MKRRGAVKWAVVTMATTCTALSARSPDAGAKASDDGAGARPIDPYGPSIANPSDNPAGGGTVNDPFVVPTASTTDTADSGLPEGACGATTLQAEDIVIEEEITVEVEIVQAEPVAIYLMLDISGSMMIPDFTGFKWDQAKQALIQFAQDPMSAGIDVALEYFPGDGQCNGDLYDVPAVGFGRLPGHAPAIVNSLNVTQPVGSGTPIEGGLRGATRACAAFQQANPTEKCVAVLITDGAPSGCDGTVAGLSAITANAYNAANSVTTFTVGMGGADFGMLNSIAIAGGSDCDPLGPGAACNVTAGPAAFSAALNLIRDTVTIIQTHTEIQTRVEQTKLDCEWGIPEPPPDKPFDKEQVNVRFAAAGTAPQQLGFVPSLAECANFQGGWHYDDADAPTKILACPETCNVIKSLDNARVDVLLGCVTEPAIPQ